MSEGSLCYPQYVLIESGGKVAYLNGDKSLFFHLPKMWRKAEDLHGPFIHACDKYGLDYSEIPDSTIIRILAEAIQNLARPSAHRPAPDIKHQGEDINRTKENAVQLTEELTREVTLAEISQILDTSIKKDDAAKLIAFAGMLLAQTDSDQLNIGFQSKSATGKSYIPTEVASYFPPNEVLLIASASPTAFFHERGIWDDKRKALIVNLEGKVLIFLDQPGFQLLERLRPFLSHDRKELEYKITDKSQRQGLRTKTVILRGFASVYFCTTKQNPDEQEKTRLVLLSASNEQGKLKESLLLASHKKGNFEEYDRMVEKDPRRIWLIQRIKAIRQSGIREVVITQHTELVYKRFLALHPYLKPRHQRDFPRIFSFIKFHALLNCFQREKLKNDQGTDKTTIIANQADIDAGFSMYEAIADSNERGLSPFLNEIYEVVFRPLLVCPGVRREEIQRKYHEIYHETLSPETLKRDILPQLESVGLIYQEPDPEDKRRLLIYPTVSTPNSFAKSTILCPDSSDSDESNRGEDSGVREIGNTPAAGTIISSKHGPSLQVLQWTGKQLRCQCSICGIVNPAPVPKDETALSEWFERHISLYPLEHGIKG